MEWVNNASELNYVFSGNPEAFGSFQKLMVSISDHTATDQSFINYLNSGGNLEDIFKYCDDGHIIVVTIPDLIIQSGHLSILKCIIELKPALINFHDGISTILARAISYNNDDMAYYLIDKGADINAECYKHKDALHFAIYNSNKKMVKTLIENGADINRDYRYNDCLSVALTQAIVSETLLFKKAPEKK